MAAPYYMCTDEYKAYLDKNPEFRTKCAKESMKPGAIVRNSTLTFDRRGKLIPNININTSTYSAQTKYLDSIPYSLKSNEYNNSNTQLTISNNFSPTYSDDEDDNMYDYWMWSSGDNSSDDAGTFMFYSPPPSPKSPSPQFSSTIDNGTLMQRLDSLIPNIA